ncbi:MAG TPA: hypothetical protein VNA24_17995 [Hyalangium sp.]|nr:hypothetical protein [Hyalangium sp.]
MPALPAIECPRYQRIVSNQCIDSIVEESKAMASARSQGYRKLWNRRIVPFARMGLIALIIAVGLCFIWPLGTLHLAMAKARDRKGLELAQLMNNAEEQFKATLKAMKLQEAAELSDHLEKVRKQILRVRRYPVWPFDAAVLTKIAIPQILALGSTLAGVLTEWLTH